MREFLCHPSIQSFKTVDEFFDYIGLCDSDLLLTNRFLYDWESLDMKGAQIIFQENFGIGEPSDTMLMRIRSSISHPYKRVIGIGGGTVMDLSKLLSLDYTDINSNTDLQELMRNNLPIKKSASIILVPTTCGTGSEVTNVAVLLLESLSIKIGLANDALFAEMAVLIPTFISSLPYKPMILSAIDAFIHSCESYLSPKATSFSKVYSIEASKRLIEGFIKLDKTGGADMETRESFLVASTMAGIAFSNAGCGMVHAMSYPIGGRFHLAHGESNYEVFIPVLRFYDSFEDKEPLENFKAIISVYLKTSPEKAIDALELLLEKVYKRKNLKDLGVTELTIKSFAKDVYQKQQRLLGNAMKPVTEEDILRVYLGS